eukprot:667248-Pyramimonas_sp.AAC.1
MAWTPSKSFTLNATTCSLAWMSTAGSTVAEFPLAVGSVRGSGGPGSLHGLSVCQRVANRESVWAQLPQECSMKEMSDMTDCSQLRATSALRKKR